MRTLLVGIATFVPGLNALHRRISRAPGTDSARYCYSVWLRHLSLASKAGLCSRTPRYVAELGPGESIGIGLAALIAGAESYTGFDVIPLTSLERNLAVFEDLVHLFRSREAIPGPSEFPEIKPSIDDYSFPHDLLDSIDLSDARMAQIRRSICQPGYSESMIRYVAPWWDSSVISPNSIDMIFSQAVLEHVDDLAHAYDAMKSWLAPGGFVAHQIDFRSHATSSTWDGHRQYGDLRWALMRGRRPYLINRAPISVHLTHLASAGFCITADIRVSSPSTVPRSRLAPKFRNLSDDDLTTSGAFILARAA